MFSRWWQSEIVKVNGLGTIMRVLIKRKSVLSVDPNTNDAWKVISAEWHELNTNKKKVVVNQFDLCFCSRCLEYVSSCFRLWTKAPRSLRVSELCTYQTKRHWLENFLIELYVNFSLLSKNKITHNHQKIFPFCEFNWVNYKIAIFYFRCEFL